MGCAISYTKCQEELCNNSVMLQNLEDKSVLLPNTNLNPSPSKTFEQEDNNYSSSIFKKSNNNNSNSNNQISNSNKNTNTKSVIGTDPEDLGQIILSEINKARDNPWTYAEKINSLLTNIETINGKQLLNYNDKVKIQLTKGKESFNDCIKYLQERKMQLPPFIFKEELKISFPIDKPDKCIDPLYLNNILSDKSVHCKDYTLVDFQYDLSPTPELSTIIQIVDDTNSRLQRRKNIFSASIKYVGINYGKMNDDVYCFYLLFAK